MARTIQEQFKTLKEGPYMALFELSVIDKRTGGKDFLVYEIEADDESIFCQRVAINEEEDADHLIAVTGIDIDQSQSLDWHLEGLLERINEEIIDKSTYFKLVEEN